ncbi:uncharacterized protein K441DRAFT_565141, partial [Cenococcum geophilum 1.58]|uniref:uncharacterized protein n=1 Tax=Cenococcum geophilum 1.58 TaxID=794803 RepID=UPI00358F7050
KLLYMIIAAIRPLTLKEINITLTIEDYYRSYNDLKPDLNNKARFKALVRHLYGLFITIVD